jgi:hypothetical protein
MQATQRIEFMGGPYDGHVQKVLLEATELAAVALLPVSRTVYAWLEGHPHPPQTRVTSVAVYEFDATGDGCRYRFARALDPAQTEIRR